MPLGTHMPVSLDLDCSRQPGTRLGLPWLPTESEMGLGLGFDNCTITGDPHVEHSWRKGYEDGFDFQPQGIWRLAKTETWQGACMKRASARDSIIGHLCPLHGFICFLRRGCTPKCPSVRAGGHAGMRAWACGRGRAGVGVRAWACGRGCAGVAWAWSWACGRGRGRGAGVDWSVGGFLSFSKGVLRLRGTFEVLLHEEHVAGVIFQGFGLQFQFP